jgi:hypothetical protein
MVASRHMLAMLAMAAAGCFCSLASAADRQGAGGQSTQPRAPQAATEESPFGGPPPMNRGKKNSVTCQVEQRTCTIKPSQPIGTPCSCPQQGGGVVRGLVVE